MTLNERIKDALAGIGIPVKPDQYRGDAKEYIVFNYNTMGVLFADDAPVYDRCLIQVHYLCPAGANTADTRKQVKRLLLQAGFTWPQEVNASGGDQRKSDGSMQHFVFECEYAEGAGLDG